ncbi:MAG: MerR family transcriptional regulator mercuric resistance operon regulatory [Geobacteraceae bacterium]|nr:MAG: MerR family transcriptional regulator mercuric resistance operon regulatory [Geobacteraceae bacterium]
MKGLTIGQVAKRGEVNIETVRYYERQGLIPPPPRRESGYRAYPEETVNRVRFSKRAQELGFSLKEIAELLSLRVGPDTVCADVRKRAVAKIAEIEQKMETLERMKEVLAGLAAECERRGPVSECPILEAMESEEDVDAEG